MIIRRESLGLKEGKCRCSLADSEANWLLTHADRRNGFILTLGMRTIAHKSTLGNDRSLMMAILDREPIGVSPIFAIEFRKATDIQDGLVQFSFHYHIFAEDSLKT